MRNTTNQLIFSGFFLALGLVLPFLTGQIPEIGSRLLPMHIPVLLCGFICGGPYGLMVGLLTPLLRSLLFSVPPMFPIAAAMSFELAAYGLLAGLLYSRLPKRNFYIYLTLIISMILGRIVWGIVSYIFYGLNGTEFNMKIFTAGAFINAVPGIIIQLVLIPILVNILNKTLSRE